MIGFVGLIPVGFFSERPRRVRRRCDEDALRGRYSTFAELAEAIQNIRDDPLASDGGRIVHYRGNPRAKLMVVGEGPGEQEDIEGKPFVGRSGKLLDKILRSVELDPEEDVYVTNTVKRRPKDNRDPTRDEIEWYLPYLSEEVRLVDPHVIVCSGKVAMTTVLPDVDSRISKVRGQWFDRWGRLVMPVFHPSYLLRNPKWEDGSPKAWTWKDFCKIKRKLNELEGSSG
uniref:Type-4 uracil-DNA glycosylase n=1 Tax=Rhodosorus marinus TaxID=101924 RepID=A0A7S3A2Z9_9RHOD|mmetsp:Transcript_42912/g.167732  ORF Transcript_42912/g.167732 Transcript_42912/m.167732 type:complete len:228 (+) Transcript_42912:2567-3250(+)|eukprot:CAMPEP_0113966556 /NCGR_PEP_ID=MMETSP0011_2-20120614/8393_1 /TAXON_ID=101924 /ORGANISM="Rhodosorus marinus" /LENGTH=227 /DNA_ID=CAMNT_0000979247 /DNA_START=157 /DNA_END=840 /DNA_ORIENTATION=- /assembly_acc=CAM_ASM_000156